MQGSCVEFYLKHKWHIHFFGYVYRNVACASKGNPAKKEDLA
jgi:hypothetical protein